MQFQNAIKYNGENTTAQFQEQWGKKTQKNKTKKPQGHHHKFIQHSINHLPPVIKNYEFKLKSAELKKLC